VEKLLAEAGRANAIEARKAAAKRRNRCVIVLVSGNTEGHIVKPI
jgi:hypothetical protein